MTEIWDGPPWVIKIAPGDVDVNAIKAIIEKAARTEPVVGIQVPKSMISDRLFDVGAITKKALDSGVELRIMGVDE